MVDLLVLTSFVQLLSVLNILFLLHNTSCLNEQVNCTEPSRSVSVPWSKVRVQLPLLIH
jgi:hypothetical protein